MNPDQQREVARLYSETSTSTAEIRGQFGIGESSLYRALQKQGVSLRGRATRPAAGAATHAPTAVSEGQSDEATSRGASVESPRRRSIRTTASANGVARQFRVHFQGQRVFDAQHVRDALRQAEALGVIEVVEVTRVD